MSRFLIEIPHEATRAACVKAVEVNSREEAQGIVPPALRPQAKIIQLNAFILEEIREIGSHQKS